MTCPAALSERAALFLDLDGTLLDFAPTPDAVVVPPGLCAALMALRRRLGDALAVVTGRPVAEVEALLGDVAYAVAGEHGVTIRPAPGAALCHAPLPDLPAAWAAEARRLVAAVPESVFEPKRHGFTLHFRRVPAAGEGFRAALAAMVATRPEAFALLQGAMVWEVRPRGVDKGSAVAALLRKPPFAGRVPVYVGDDVTDEDGIRAAMAAGGIGLRVADAFGSPEAVRAWIAREAFR